MQIFLENIFQMEFLRFLHSPGRWQKIKCQDKILQMAQSRQEMQGCHGMINCQGSTAKNHYSLVIIVCLEKLSLIQYLSRDTNLSLKRIWSYSAFV